MAPGTFWPIDELKDTLANNAQRAIKGTLDDALSRLSAPSAPAESQDQPTGASVATPAPSFMANKQPTLLSMPGSSAPDQAPPAPEPPSQQPSFSSLVSSLTPWDGGQAQQAQQAQQPAQPLAATKSFSDQLSSLMPWAPNALSAPQPLDVPNAYGPARASGGGATPPPGAGPIDNSSRAAFVQSAWPHMLAAAGGNRDAAEMMLAAAISENGSVGTGRPFWANNFFGIKGQGPAGSVNAATWEQTPGGPQNINDDFAAYNTPTEGFGGFFDFLKNNRRYNDAMASYQQTGDAEQLFRDINAAGYATDPNWASNVSNIRANQVAPITRGLADQQQAPPAPTLQAMSQPMGPMMPQGTYSPENLVPNQLSEGQAQGLTTQEALAVCGPAAAVAFARANGRNPTLAEAKQLAQHLGLWDTNAGMHGPASEVALLNQMGVSAAMHPGADWNTVRSEVSSGRPVILNTPGHYYVATAVRDTPYGPEYQLGESANVLAKSRGQTWWRPDEIPSLGMGDINAVITMGRGQ